MDKELYQIAVNAVEHSYHENVDLGTTELLLTKDYYRGEKIQILSSPGSNEGWDWLENAKVWSKYGYKKAGYDAAVDILISKYFRKERDRRYKLLISVHSKSGPNGVTLKHHFKEGDWLTAFAPAPGMRRSLDRHMENTALFFDPDDIVHEAGIINFGHPITPYVYIGKNDHIGKHLKDHLIPHWVEFVKNMKDSKPNWWTENHPEGKGIINE